MNLQNLKLLELVAGLDLSDYFDGNGKPKMKEDGSGEMVPIFPAVYEIASDENRVTGCYWWEDPLYMIGKVTSQEREIRILNTLTHFVVNMRVCEEDTVGDIKLKYFNYNRNLIKYDWKKYDGERSEDLQDGKTLTENGILFEDNEKLGLPHAIWLHYINTP